MYRAWSSRLRCRRILSAAPLILVSFMGAAPEQLMGLFLPRNSRFDALKRRPKRKFMIHFGPSSARAKGKGLTAA